MAAADTTGSLSTAIADILADDYAAVAKRIQIYFNLGLDGGNNFSKLDKDAGNDSWSFFHGMMNLHFEKTWDTAVGINQLVTVLKSLQLVRCAKELEERIFMGFKEPFIFNMENLCQNFTGRENELKILEDLVVKRQNEESNVAVLTSVSGIGGVGKTTLARKFALVFRDKYNVNVAWITCGNLDSVENAFIQLYIELNNSSSQIPKTNKLIRNRIFDYLSTSPRNTLFVFDNLDDPKADWIWDFIPTEKYGYHSRIYCLITSRRQDILEKGNTLNLDVLPDSDAKLLVKKELQDVEDDSVEKLVRELGNFPLAIRIATSIIKRCKTRSTNQATLNYITDFSLAKKKCTHAAAVELGRYHLTTSATVKISIDRIKQTEINYLLLLCSFLNAEKISREMLEKLIVRSPIQQKENMSWFEAFFVQIGLYTPKTSIPVSLKGLDTYLEQLSICSLIVPDFESDYYKMHRVVQDSVRLIFGKKEKELMLNHFVNFFSQIDLPKYSHHFQALLFCCFEEFKQNQISDKVLQNLLKSDSSIIRADFDFGEDTVLFEIRFVEQYITSKSEFTIVTYYLSLKEIEKSEAWESNNKTISKFRTYLSKVFEKITLNDIDIQLFLLSAILKRKFGVKFHHVNLLKLFNLDERMKTKVFNIEKLGLIDQVEEYLQSNEPQILLIEKHFEAYLYLFKKLKIDRSISKTVENSKCSADFGYLIPILLIHNSKTGELPETIDKHCLSFTHWEKDKQYIKSLTYGQLYSTIFPWNINNLFVPYSNLYGQLKFGISLFDCIDTYLEPEQINQICNFLSGKTWSIEELPKFFKKLKAELDNKLTTNNINPQVVSAFTQYSIFIYLCKDEDKSMWNEFEKIPGDFQRTFFHMDFNKLSNGISTDDIITMVIFAASATLDEKMKVFRRISSPEFFCMFDYSLNFSCIMCNVCFTLYKDVQNNDRHITENMFLLPLRLHQRLKLKSDKGYATTRLIKMFMDELSLTSQNVNFVCPEWRTRYQHCFKELEYKDSFNETNFSEGFFKLLKSYSTHHSHKDTKLDLSASNVQYVYGKIKEGFDFDL